MALRPRTAVVLAADKTPSALGALFGKTSSAMIPVNGCSIIHWSLRYSRTDDAGWVREVREKEATFPWASTGTHWFARGRDFVTLARRQAATQNREKREFYVGPLFNGLIGTGGRVRNFEIDRLFCFGTPEDLKYFLRSRATSKVS